MQVTGLNVYPVKGLRAVPLQAVTLQPNCGVPGDREWALLLGSAQGVWDADRPEVLFGGTGSAAPISSSPAAPLWHGSKYKFHQLINSPELAKIEVCSYSPEDGSHLVLSGPSKQGEQVELDVRLATAEGLEAAERFFASFLRSYDRLKQTKQEDGPVSAARGHGLSLCHAKPGATHQFGNVGGPQGQELVHIVSLASVRALDAARTCAAGGKTVERTDPRQFRANIYLDGEDLQPFTEFSWCGGRVQIGEDLELEILEPTIRCPASSVHPERGTRERQVASELREFFPAAAARVGGHGVPLGGSKSRGGFMGVYARVVRAGTVRTGDNIRVASPPKASTSAATLAWAVGFACIGLTASMAAWSVVRAKGQP
mmetsp:Transcript_56125/g.166919  ORF Transcript_56125/g.166919 Transcript_56125/m.166919 type:complete len:372 (-) Transcript_56125:37-1152(-)